MTKAKYSFTVTAILDAANTIEAADKLRGLLEDNGFEQTVMRMRRSDARPENRTRHHRMLLLRRPGLRLPMPRGRRRHPPCVHAPMQRA